MNIRNVVFIFYILLIKTLTSDSKHLGVVIQGFEEVLKGSKYILSGKTLIFFN